MERGLGSIFSSLVLVSIGAFNSLRDFTPGAGTDSSRVPA